MAYRLKDYLYNDKLTKEQNILMDRLYKLRMSGMAEAFEKQLLEPNTGLEPFEVRFAAIVNQEWDQRESKKFKRLMKKATLKYPAADLDSSIYDPERQLNTHVIELLAKCDWIDEPNNLLMTGGAGAGKTHIACALCITAMHQNRTVKYMRANTLLKESDHARQEGTYFEYSNEMAAYDLMVIDDFGLMDLDIELKKIKEMEDPVLLSGTDGCGTKVKLAMIMDKHDTIGIDAVAMCVNDIACAGGEPLFFLDYIACGKNFPEKIASIVSGVAEGCKQSEAALIGGETAEMPGFYPEDEYDLAGFAVGIVDEKDLITGKDIKAGDVLVGIASSGIHSNGYSLVRKVFPMEKEALNEYREELGKTLGEALITPTKIYVKALKAVKEAGITIKGCSHITGGGFYENIPRMLPEGARAVVKKDSYEVPAIFRLLAKEGNIAEEMMYNTYNMGIGMMLALDPKDAEKAIEALKAVGEEAYVVGSVEAGEKGVTLC